jgi:hypothetical protein
LGEPLFIGSHRFIVSRGASGCAAEDIRDQPGCRKTAKKTKDKAFARSVNRQEIVLVVVGVGGSCNLNGLQRLFLAVLYKNCIGFRQ